MQNFFINHYATLPYLCVTLVNDGRYDFKKFNECIQDASITFSMFNQNNHNIRVANEPCEIKLLKGHDCEDKYCIIYKWKQRDTKEKGTFIGKFNIKFKGNITSPVNEYPVGELIVPIQDELYINIK